VKSGNKHLPIPNGFIPTDGYVHDIDTGQAKGMAHEPEEGDQSESEGEEQGGGAKTTSLLEDSQDMDVKVADEDNTVHCPCGVNEVRQFFQEQQHKHFRATKLTNEVRRYSIWKYLIQYFHLHQPE